MDLYPLSFKHVVSHCQDAGLIQRSHKYPGKNTFFIKPLSSHLTPTTTLFLSCYYCLAPGKGGDGAALGMSEVWVSQVGLPDSFLSCGDRGLPTLILWERVGIRHIISLRALSTSISFIFSYLPVPLLIFLLSPSPFIKISYYPQGPVLLLLGNP